MRTSPNSRKKSPRRYLLPCAIILAAAAVFAFGKKAVSPGLVVTDLNNGVTVPDLVNALVGPGVTVSNITFTGNFRAAGTFTGPTALVGFPSGIVLGSGSVQTSPTDVPCSRGIEGPNDCTEFAAGVSNSTDFGNPGDPDLTLLSGFPTQDAAVLEFDFVPQFSNLQFKYVFSSEEYSDYSNTVFNDVFAFFVNGTNCALVPVTAEPVSVDTINNGNDLGGDPTPHHPELFRDNVNPSPTLDTQMDGLTVVMTCGATVNPGQPNHMKLAVADASDGIFDTAVFIKTGSLVSGTVITTTLTGGGQSGEEIHVGQGVPVTDSSILRGGNSGSATGTVTYSIYSDGDCLVPFANAGVKNVVNGIVPDSDPVTFNQYGTFYWIASYSGDANNNPSATDCGEEEVEVTDNVPTITPTPTAITTVTSTPTQPPSQTPTPTPTGTPTNTPSNTPTATPTNTPTNTPIIPTPTPAAVLLTLSPPEVIGGVPSTGTVTLSSPAPAGGASVALVSSDITAATVPASVPVAAGTTSRTFTVTTKAVAAQVSVTISASYGGSTSPALLTVDPAVLTSLTVSPASVIGGKNSKGTVTLNGKAPGAGAIVALESVDSSASVPATVKIASGSTSATFTITTVPVPSTVGPFNIAASYDNLTFTAPLTVQQADPSKLVVSPASVLGGVSSKGTVTLTGAAPAGGAVVTLGSANPAATVPATITVPAGSSSTTFPITTIPVAVTQGPFDISAAYNAVTVKDQLTVQAAALSKIVVTPSSLTGGAPASGTVTLTGNAPAGDAVVSLASANPAAAVPASVTVFAGTKTATFPITTFPVAVSTRAFNISAAYNAVTKTDKLTVKAPAVLSIVLDPATVTGGGLSVATVTLNGAAPLVGTIVTLKSSDLAVATVPPALTVAATDTQATFNVTSLTVAISSTAKISATAGGSTKTATLTVTP